MNQRALIQTKLQAAIHHIPPLPHSLAWVRSVADDVGIRASNAPRRIGLLRAICQFGTNRKVFLSANFWPRFRAPNYIRRTLGFLARMLRSIGASADLQRHDNTAEHESLGVFLPRKTGHRCLTCAVEIKILGDNRRRCKRPILAPIWGILDLADLTPDRPMLAISRHSEGSSRTSALPPKADIGEGIAGCPLLTHSGH